MSDPKIIELPDGALLDHETGTAPDGAPAAPVAQARMWTKDEEQKIVQFAQTAKTPEELSAFTASLGRDRQIGLPLDGPGGTRAMLEHRDQTGSVPNIFAIPDFAKGEVAADVPPEGVQKLAPDAKIDYGTKSGLSPDEIKARVEKLPEMLRPGLTDLAGSSYVAGLDNEGVGLAHALGSMLMHPEESIRSHGRNIADAYHEGRTNALMMDDYARLQHPDLAPVAEIGGAIANPIGRSAKGLLALAKVGAGFGAVTGFEEGNGGLGERLGTAAKDAGIGAFAAPVVAGLIKAPGAILNAGKTVLGDSPSLARRIVAKAIKSDEATPGEVGSTLSAAHANDVPMMLADTGENARGLLAAAGRSSGPARTLTRDILEQRQSGLGERVTNAIERDLGPVSNPHEVADKLMTKANNEAGPLYDRAYARPGAGTFGDRVAPLLARPSMKGALRKAYRIADEEGRDPKALGFDIDEAGEVTLKKVPSWQTLDYVKRGMDDVVESYRDPTSGRLNLNTEGRAINNTLRSFLGQFDAANPDYKAARAAYAGPVRGIDAMNQGRKAINMTANDLEARIRDMSPFEKQMFALGHRRAMAEMVQSKGDSANVINALVGTGKKRAMLARLHGDRPAFGRFTQTLDQEKEGFRTFAKALSGSPTAANLEDDATLKLASTAADMALNGGLPIGTAIRHAIKFGVSKAGDRTKQQVAALLSETDPTKFREMADTLRKEAIRRGLVNHKVMVLGNAGGKATAAAASQ